MSALFINPLIPVLDANGAPISGAQLHFYATGTLVEADTYTTEALTTAHANPVIADSAGRHAPIFLDSAVDYRLIVKDASGTTIKDYDPYTGSATQVGATKTPYMFGAVGDGVTDDSVALQAFFDDAWDAENGLKYTYDFRGEWATSRTIYAAYEYQNPRPELGRRFICGQIRVLNSPTLDTFTVQQGDQRSAAFVISGYRQSFEGTLYINGMPYDTSTTPPTVSGFPTYANSRFDIGVLMVDCGYSKFDTIEVDGAKRDGVTLYEDTFVLRPGHAKEVDHGGAEANNIGITIQSVNCRYCGSYSATTGRGLSTAISIITQGGISNTSDESSFEAVPASYGDSSSQRTQLTVASTSGLNAKDIVKGRVEIASSVFTSISADATAGTLTWTAGDPTAAPHSLAVGDKISLIDGSGVGVNDGVTFEIISFSGGSNRTITVWPKPTTEAAKVYTQVVSAWSYHQVRYVRSSTQLEVSPWWPSRNNSSLYSCHGWGVNANGRNTANLNIQFLTANNSGGGLAAFGLYNAHIGSLKPEGTEVGVAMGEQQGASAIGLVIDHIHAEASAVPFMAIGNESQASIKGGSDLSLVGVMAILPRTNVTDGPMPDAALQETTIDRGGNPLVFGAFNSHQGVSTALNTSATALSNAPNRRYCPMPFNSFTAYVHYDYDMGRLGGRHNWAIIPWVGPSTAPSGTATFNLSTELVQRGWAFAGLGSSTTFALTTSRACDITFTFDKTNKLVIVGMVSRRRVLEGSATFDPASVASGAQTSTTVTVTGAALGDYVQVAPSISPGGLILTGHVTAADTVTVYYANLSGGAVDLASHTIRALVEKR